MRETFSKTNVLRRMHGIIDVEVHYLNNPTYFKACMFLARQVPGRLMLVASNPESLRAQGCCRLPWRVERQLSFLTKHIMNTERLSYMFVFNTCLTSLTFRPLENKSTVILSSTVNMCCNRFCLKYQPAQLNGHHVLDLAEPLLNFNIFDSLVPGQNMLKDWVTSVSRKLNEDFQIVDMPVKRYDYCYRRDKLVCLL